MTRITAQNEQQEPSTGHVFWLFGLSGAGKTTLATLLRERIRLRIHQYPLMLDGDRLRTGLSLGLGYDDAGRTENLRRAAYAAELGVASGLIVIAAFITPMETQRAMIRAIIGPSRITFVHVDAPVEVCAKRDVKGLYAMAHNGQVSNLTGRDAKFDPPPTDAIIVDSAGPSPQASVAQLWSAVLGYIPSTAATGSGLRSGAALE